MGELVVFPGRREEGGHGGRVCRAEGGVGEQLWENPQVSEDLTGGDHPEISGQLLRRYIARVSGESMCQLVDLHLTEGPHAACQTAEVYRARRLLGSLVSYINFC